MQYEIISAIWFHLKTTFICSIVDTSYYSFQLLLRYATHMCVIYTIEMLVYMLVRHLARISFSNNTDIYTSKLYIFRQSLRHQLHNDYGSGKKIYARLHKKKTQTTKTKKQHVFNSSPTGKKTE